MILIFVCETFYLLSIKLEPHYGKEQKDVFLGKISNQNL